MVVLKKNSCRICLKVFCCSDCRDIHESSKHPKPKCSLCVRQDLPYKPNPDKTSPNEESRKNAEFLCHIVFNHLPLRCKLCGDKYTTNQDLVDANPCRWWSERNKRLQQNQKTSQIGTLSSSRGTAANTEDLESTLEKKLPLTPQFFSIEANKSLRTVDTSSILRLKQEHFDSPPELVRHTSTPVHPGVALPGQKQQAGGQIPQFLLKTPSSCDKRPSFESTVESAGSACSRAGSSGYESRYYTGISSSIGPPLGRFSISSVNNNSDVTRENQSEVDPSWNSPSYSILKKQLEPASAEVNADRKNRIERSIMKPDALDRISRLNDTSRDSIEKRVRFSDQCLVPASTTIQELAAETADNSAYFAASDIFFEARESLDEVEDRNNNSGPAMDDEKKAAEIETRNDKNQSDSCACCCRNGKTMNVGNDSPSSSTAGCNNNNNDEKKNENVVDSSVEVNKSSSRVVMMLLVEQTDSKGLSSLDLAPLIDSGLKKLEESVASANRSTNINKGSHDCSDATTKFSAEVLSGFARKVNGSLGPEDKGAGGKGQNAGSGSARASIQDSFVSISDRVECYRAGCTTPPKQSQEVSGEEQLLANKAEARIGGDGVSSTSGTTACGSYKSDGIFSVVARVVRSAFKKLPAVSSVTSSRNLSREPVPQSACPSSSCSSTSSSVTSTSSLSIASAEVLAVGDSCSATASRVVLQRSASKRPRDRIDSGEEQQHHHHQHQQHAPSRHSPGSSVSPRSEVVSSPAAKRHRGWYRIRAREPIARMRDHQLVPRSPRGASLETQRFQQGSLTIGDTFLPLPSRAHQSTQTED